MRFLPNFSPFPSKNNNALVFSLIYLCFHQDFSALWAGIDVQCNLPRIGRCIIYGLVELLLLSVEGISEQ